MQVEVLYRPSYSMARVLMNPGEAVRAETGAMVSMSPGLQVETKMQGGLLQSLARSVLGGESFFVNTFRASNQPGELMLAPTMPGDLLTYYLRGENVLVQRRYDMSSAESVNVDTKWGGAKTFFGGEGLIMLRCAGAGTLILSSYGAIHEVNLGAGQMITVDTGHLVAFDERLGFKVRAIGGLKSTLLGGEGLVVDLTGPGQVLLQTRSMGAFLEWLLPRLPKQHN